MYVCVIWNIPFNWRWLFKLENIKKMAFKSNAFDYKYLLKQKWLKKDQLPSLLLDTHLKNSTINLA